MMGLLCPGMQLPEETGSEHLGLFEHGEEICQWSVQCTGAIHRQWVSAHV